MTEQMDDIIETLNKSYDLLFFGFIAALFIMVVLAGFLSRSMERAYRLQAEATAYGHATMTNGVLIWEVRK